MSARKLPGEAFSFYVSLGPERSYQAVAREYGVTKRTVVRRAQQEDWQRRIKKIESEARARVDKKAVESLEEVAERHMKILRAIQSKAIQALQSLEIASAMDAVRALDLTVKAERLVRGDPQDRDQARVEEVTREEVQSLLATVEDDDDEGEDW